MHAAQVSECTQAGVSRGKCQPSSCYLYAYLRTLLTYSPRSTTINARKLQRTKGVSSDTVVTLEVSK